MTNRQDILICPYCKADPFSYIQTESGLLPLAVTCCEKAIHESYQGLESRRQEPTHPKLLPPEMPNT